MPPLSKPYRVAFLVPDLTLDGPDAPYEAEAALLLWAALVEMCQRHTQLSVYDAESTPLFPRDGHFEPHRAMPGATPTDGFYGSTRRDELLWLELTLPRGGALKLHALARDGRRQTFEALGRNLGDQINQAVTAWLAARKLGAPARRLESVTIEEFIGVVRVLGPILVEQARSWTPPEVAAAATPDDAGLPDDAPSDEPPVVDDVAMAVPTIPDATAVPAAALRPRAARVASNRLPQTLRVPALRVLELALRDELGDLILALDPDHPQALFSRYLSSNVRDTALLRRVIAAAPGWARPNAELAELEGDSAPVGGVEAPEDRASRPGSSGRRLAKDEPTHLECAAGAAIAALSRPGQLALIDSAARRLRDDGRTDEAVRQMARAVGIHDTPTAHLALLQLHRATERVGTWLAQAQRSSLEHGCPVDAFLPWYPDQIMIDLHLSEALLHAGRLDEAIALRANRLEGREETWPRHTAILKLWRKDARLAAWAYAREGHFRGDPARTLEGFARLDPTAGLGDSLDVAIFLDALVAMDRAAEVPLAWAQFGVGPGRTTANARLAAARGSFAAGDWRRGLEELWRAELGEPGRDEQVAVARLGLLLSCMPLDVAEAALAERVAIGAHSLARRMARDIADFLPGAAKSSIVMRALGSAKATSVELDAAAFSGFPQSVPGRAEIDALFDELAGKAAGGDPLVRADRLVERWLEVVYTGATDEHPVALAQAATYAAAQALARYFAATTVAPSPIAGALRTVASEALALVRRHQDALADRDVRALLGAIDPMLRRVDRWVGTAWLATVERSCAIDERAGGDVTGFVRDHATVAARILGPEEAAVLAASVARLHRERPDGWDSATAAQAERLALHTGFVGVEEWCDAVVAQLAARQLDLDDAIDALHTACFLAEGRSPVPCVHAARVLFDAGRPRAALPILAAGLGSATEAWRTRELPKLAPAWKQSNLDIPFAVDEVVQQLEAALHKGEPGRAEKLGRWAVALAPANHDAHRNLGLALAQQGKSAEALQHLVRAMPEKATRILADVLTQAQKAPEAAAVQAYAGRWSRTADPEDKRPDIFKLLEAGDFAAAAATDGGDWKVQRAALAAARFRTRDEVGVAPRALAAAGRLVARAVRSAETPDRELALARMLALDIREHAAFARDPLPQLGERMTREAFLQELRNRGVTVASEPAPPSPPFVDRVVVQGSKVARASDYVALIRDLAALAPREALAQFDLDDAGYHEVATAWAAAIDKDPSVARTIAAGMAKRLEKDPTIPPREVGKVVAPKKKSKKPPKD